MALLTTLGRFAIHWKRRQRIAWDDVFNGMAMVFLLAYTGTYQVFGPADYTNQLYGMGIIKKEDIIEGNARKNARYNAANTLLFWCVIYAAKGSFLALYWHIFSYSTKFRIAWAVTTAYIPASFIVTFMWSFFLCGNPKYFPDTQRKFHDNDIGQHTNNLLAQCHENAPSRVKPMLAAWCALDLIGDILCESNQCSMLQKPELTVR